MYASAPLRAASRVPYKDFFKFADHARFCFFRWELDEDVPGRWRGKKALLMSWIMSLLGLDFRGRLAHLETRYLMNSKGEVAANNSGQLSILISFAKILDLYCGMKFVALVYVEPPQFNGWWSESTPLYSPCATPASS